MISESRWVGQEIGNNEHDGTEIDAALQHAEYNCLNSEVRI